MPCLSEDVLAALSEFQSNFKLLILSPEHEREQRWARVKE
jgi:hypothetical protein